MGSFLKTEGLSHQYNTRSWAVRDINLSIGQKGIVGLLGTNGAGKSTVMNIICGTLNQTAGQVSIDGIDLRERPVEARRQIGFLPQTLPLYIDLTVNEYLSYSAELRCIPDDSVKKSLEQAKERCGLTHVGHRLIRNLSGGYRQRVGIAQAIIHQPKLVVMDEPTNGLDPNQLIEVRKLIRDIGRDHAVLFSSHVLSEVQLLCRDIVMIEAGRVVFSDTMEAFHNFLKSDCILLKVANVPFEGDLTRIAGVSRVEFQSAQQIRIYFEGGDDIIDRVAEAALRHGWGLREIGFDKSMLDDTFHQISTRAHK